MTKLIENFNFDLLKLDINLLLKNIFTNSKQEFLIEICKLLESISKLATKHNKEWLVLVKSESDLTNLLALYYKLLMKIYLL